MRTLIRCTFTRGTEREVNLKKLSEWLVACCYEPETVTLDSASQELAMDHTKEIPTTSHRSQQDNPSTKNAATDPPPPENTLAKLHALEVLRSIPLDDGERDEAMRSNQLIVIRDIVHGSTIWGLVCVHHPHVDVRWRHRVTRVLEPATERFVDWVWKNCAEKEPLFSPFSIDTEDGTVVPVREPRDTNDIYRGHVLPPRGSARAVIAKRASGPELRAAIVSLVLTSVLLVVAYILFIASHVDSPLRWGSGVFDRLATGFMAAGFLSYLTYRFRVSELNKRRTIHWE